MSARPSEFWYCNACHAQNHETDGECQYCECGGAACPRDNCSDPRHFADRCTECDGSPASACPVCGAQAVTP